MAEVLGLAASVIAVVDMTSKVGSASLKLMRLWNEVKEVPAMLLEKAERIKDLEEFLDDTENQIARNLLPEAVCNMARLQKHIAKARGALTNVQEMVDHLQAKVNADQRSFKRRFASTKVLLQKDEWKALDANLDSALYLFSIAQTQYLIATSTFCTSFMLEGLPASTKVPDQALAENGYPFETDDQNSTRKRKSNSALSTVSNVFHMPYSKSVLPTFRFGFGVNGSFQFSVSTPTWLTGSVYSILAQRSFQGWQLNLRAYEVVRYFDTELDYHLKADDALAIFRYLDEHKMTPYARDWNDRTLLWFAVYVGAFKVSKLLLERGLESCVYDPFLELFADHGLDNILSGSVEKIKDFLSYGISYRAFRAFLKRYGFRYDSMPVNIRLEHLRELAESCSCWSPEEVLLILPEAEHVNAEILRLSMEEDCALLHSFVLAFAWRLTMEVTRQRGEQGLEEKKQWSKLLHTCIRQDSLSLHRLESIWSWKGGYGEASPLSAMTWSLVGGEDDIILSATRLVVALESVFTAWIAVLSSCEVDLLGYGRQERRLYEEGSTHFGRRWAPWTFRTEGRARFSLIGLTYGSRPEQWRLWWALEYEDYAGEFWNLVESQAFKMPGSWVDEPWDPDDFDAEEGDRQEIWEREETTPLVWSEYRKIRPPV
ncbi:ankyrin repeat-containing protein [Colletotrichum tofieldiae]|nr:ankyrin repeat-containing protein [Colletotrichum tofieldiae]